MFNTRAGFSDLPVTVPCGQCIGCRLERSRQWAMRCVHEAQLYRDNCFITLTYDDNNLPTGGTLVKKHFQDFFKRLRHHNQPKTIRYFMCGEYGEQSSRPHYHACLFNHDFEDKIHYSTKGETKLYISQQLQLLWPYGFTTVGTLTFESAAYVARYIVKKVTGEKAQDHYTALDWRTGEITQIIPEYTNMSRRCGIGKEWYNRFKSDCYPEDNVVVRGKEMKPPKYYDSMYEIEAPKEYKKLKENRRQSASVHYNNNTSERLRIREKVKTRQITALKRSI